LVAEQLDETSRRRMQGFGPMTCLAATVMQWHINTDLRKVNAVYIQTNNLVSNPSPVNPFVPDSVYEVCFRCRTRAPQHAPHKVEDVHPVGRDEAVVDPGGEKVKQDVEVGAEAKLGRVLPRLKEKSLR
jgi:hypothetical protein